MEARTSSGRTDRETRGVLIPGRALLVSGMSTPTMPFTVEGVVGKVKHVGHHTFRNRIDADTIACR
jgi:hypothetical protein